MIARTLPLALLLLAGCAGLDAPPPAPPPAGPAETIRYETGPCFGACPVYAVTVTPAGALHFEGRRFTAVTGARDLQIGPAGYRRFADALSAYRPVAGDEDYSGRNCSRIATDLPTVDISWTLPGQPPKRLHFYYGCDMEANRPIADALRAAPSVLPLQGYVK